MIIHTKASDASCLDKLLLLRSKFRALLSSSQFVSFLENKNIHILLDLDKLPMSVLKGWLFQYYSFTNNRTLYESLNQKVKDNIHKVSKLASLSDIQYRNELYKIQQLFYRKTRNDKTN